MDRNEELQRLKRIRRAEFNQPNYDGEYLDYLDEEIKKLNDELLTEEEIFLYNKIDWVWVFQTYRWCNERNFRILDKAAGRIAKIKPPKRGDDSDLTI